MEFKFTVEQLNNILEILAELPIKHGAVFEKVKKAIEEVTVAQIKANEAGELANEVA